MKTLIDNPYFTVYANAHFDNIKYKNMVVSFSARGSGDGKEANPFGNGFFDSREVPAVFFCAKYNNWWHSDYILDAVQVVRSISQEKGMGIIAYGSSMGGTHQFTYHAISMQKQLWQLRHKSHS